MKKIYLCMFFLIYVALLNAQNDNCSGFVSDENYLRYTAFGSQQVVDGNHSKAINESRKIANITAECELSKMISSMVTSVTNKYDQDEETSYYTDTLLVSSYKIFNGINTVCQSKTKLIDNVYVTYVTKEVSIKNISDAFSLDDDKRKRFIELIEKE